MWLLRAIVELIVEIGLTEGFKRVIRHYRKNKNGTDTARDHERDNGEDGGAG